MPASEGYIAKKRSGEIKEVKEFREIRVFPVVAPSHCPIIPPPHLPTNKKNRVESNFQPYYHYRYAT